MVCCCGKLQFDLSHSDHGPKQPSVSSLIYVFSHVNYVGLKSFCLSSICCQFFFQLRSPGGLAPRYGLLLNVQTGRTGGFSEGTVHKTYHVEWKRYQNYLKSGWWGSGGGRRGCFPLPTKSMSLYSSTHMWRRKLENTNLWDLIFELHFFYLCLCWLLSPTGIKFWEQFQRQAWTKMFDSLRSDLITVSWQKLCVGNKL